MEKISEFYRALAAEVGDIIERLGGDIVYCDAVEFYNPVHDIALPVVRAALGGNDLPVLEVPLIYQTTAGVAEFELQRVPDSLSSQGITVDLSHEELDRKIATIESGVYQMLFAQLGSVILHAVPFRAEREHFLRGRNVLPSPAPEQVLRYELRGRALRDAGAIREVITFDEHYAPIFAALCNAT